MKTYYQAILVPKKRKNLLLKSTIKKPSTTISRPMFESIIFVYYLEQLGISFI